MSSITTNQRRANNARALDLAVRLSEALRELPEREANDVISVLVERIQRDDATRPKATQ